MAAGQADQALLADRLRDGISQRRASIDGVRGFDGRLESGPSVTAQEGTDRWIERALCGDGQPRATQCGSVLSGCDPGANGTHGTIDRAPGTRHLRGSGSRVGPGTTGRRCPARRAWTGGRRAWGRPTTLPGDPRTDVRWIEVRATSSGVARRGRPGLVGHARSCRRGGTGQSVVPFVRCRDAVRGARLRRRHRP